ncbi:Os05g0319850 [Oryza sativa Japonica Group]|uniref:Os05g0319850 protein n=1 Tax=Oryza sativa subsp. japonica TaxID=39947 RepID=A0A0P0WKK4_ORYSJ|nr:hypothetical protein EE612_028637 [Oryza sativa]BAS93351.1 Os05g0319850 [Oryza sativa Japonica Group]
MSGHREEVGVADGPEEEDGGEGEVGAEDDAGGEDLLEAPCVGQRGRLDAVLGDGHDGAVVEDGDDEHHEGREVEPPDERQEEEAEHDADGDRHGVDGVVLHPLEDGAARQHRADDHAKPGLRQHDVRRPPRRVRRVRHRDPDVRLLQRRRVVHAVPRHPADVLPLLQPPHDLVTGNVPGKTPAKPSAFSMSSSTGRPPVSPSLSRELEGYMLVPMPRRRPVSLPMASWSPVIILTLTPRLSARRMVSELSWRGGSKSGSTARNCHGVPGASLLPSGTFCLATASDRSPRSANLSMMACTRRLTS